MTEHKNIYIALAAAQSGMGKVAKGSVNPAFKSRYADLADVVSVAVPALTEQGIAMYHSMTREDAGLIMRTTLSHGASDTHIHCDVPLIVNKNDMQGMKSATTYAKRIGVESLTGIAPDDDDDDGNAAAKAQPRQDARQTEQTKTKQPESDVEAAQRASAYIAGADSLDDLQARWANIPKPVKAMPDVIAAKDAAKAHLTKPVSADLAGDDLPF